MPLPFYLVTEICRALQAAYPASDRSAAILRSMPPNNRGVWSPGQQPPGKAIAMAKADERHDWLVDDRCIGLRRIGRCQAPELIVWNGDRVRFSRQPSSPAEEGAV